MLIYGIMSSIAQFYSRNLATEVLSQKIAQGGTPKRVPVAYRNIRYRDDNGREARTVELDPGRAPMSRWALETYATGDVSAVQRLRVTDEAGLRDEPSRNEVR